MADRIEITFRAKIPGITGYIESIKRILKEYLQYHIDRLARQQIKYGALPLPEKTKPKTREIVTRELAYKAEEESFGKEPLFENLQVLHGLYRIELRRQTPIRTGRMRRGWRVSIRGNRLLINNSEVYWRWICFGRQSPHRGLLDRVRRKIDQKMRIRSRIIWVR